MNLFWCVVYWLKGIRIGFSGIRKIQLGSRVFHDGEWWFVSNWAGEPRMNLSQGTPRGTKSPYKERVPRKEIRSSRSLAEFVHRFSTIRRWYMTSWFRIDVQRHTLAWDGSRRRLFGRWRR